MASSGGRVYGKPVAVPAVNKEPPPPRKAIPIIFLPGVMGSNLRVRGESEAEVRKRFEADGRGKEYTRKAWDLPNVFYSDGALGKELALEATLFLDSPAVKTGKRWKGYGPKFRQVMLNPETTEVDDTGFIPADLPRIDGQPGHQVARDRGWGTVHWDSYGPFLLHLQTTLNPMPHVPRGSAMARQIFSASMPFFHSYNLMGDDAPTDAAIAHAADYHYPVFAAGYNWTRSNRDSAEYLLKRIETWLQQLHGANYLCSKVILVTHSMGGFVARAAVKMDREGKQRILGVVHGAMPATGAPALFAQLVKGEPGSNVPGPLYDLRNVLPNILGRTPAEVTAVVANAQGCLELLPSSLYPPGWLRVEREWSQDDIRLMVSLPSEELNDPYKEIYQAKEDVSWRMIDPELLDPAEFYKGEKKKAWDAFIKRIDDVKDFHLLSLAKNNYHPNTYSFHGAGSRAYHAVRLRFPVPPNVFNAYDPKNKKTITGHLNLDGGKSDGNPAIDRLTFPKPVGKLQPTPFPPGPSKAEIDLGIEPGPPMGKGRWLPPDGDGDGTVSHQSGCAPQYRVTKHCRITGFKHQDAYNTQPTRAFTVLAICKIANLLKGGSS